MDSIAEVLKGIGALLTGIAAMIAALRPSTRKKRKRK